MLVVDGVCAPARCIPVDGIDGAVDDGALAGGVPRYGVVVGTAVLVVVVVECSPQDY